MKKSTFIELIETVIVFTLTTFITMFLAQATHAASLQKVTRQINKQIELINQLENNNENQQAFQATVQLQQYLETVLQVNQVIVATDSKLTEINLEKVTSRTSSGFSIFGLLLSGGGSYSSQTTEMFLQNGNEKNNFSSKKEKDLLKLKSDLRNYLNTNIDGIVLLKLVQLKMLSLAIKMNYTGLAYLEKLSLANSKLSFLGLQTVTHCVQNNYIDDKMSASAGLSLLGLIGFGATYESTAYANTTKSCNSSFNQIISDREPVMLISLNNLDDKIANMKKLLFLNAINKNQADYFPTFDSPYYK